MSFLTLTQSTWFLIGPIAKLLGYVMNYIFEFINWIGIPNIGIAIILFTLIVKALMIPLSIKQQKYTKLQSLMAPELQLIQKKYQNPDGSRKTDNASVMAQQEETKAVYEKYGTSATGGCLQLLIQMPILFALYQVIYHMPGYIDKLYGYYDQVANALMNIKGFETNEALLALAKANNIDGAKFVGSDGIKYVIDMLYNFDPMEWKSFLGIFNDGALTNAYEAVRESITSINHFCGFDLTQTPLQQLADAWWVVFVPLLAGALQFVSSKLMSTNQPQQTVNDKDENPLASSMKTMNYIFPIMSVVFCFMFSTGIGVYWVASSGVQLVIQLLVNAYMNKVDINEMVRQNIEKANVKRVKKGKKPLKFTSVLDNAKSIEEEQRLLEEQKKILKAEAENSTQYYQSHSPAKPGSLAAKAGMVLQYDERMKERKSGKKN